MVEFRRKLPRGEKQSHITSRRRSPLHCMSGSRQRARPICTRTPTIITPVSFWGGRVLSSTRLKTTWQWPTPKLLNTRTDISSGATSRGGECQKKKMAGSTHPVHFDLHAGECLYLPAGWAHSVQTPEPSLMVSYWHLRKPGVMDGFNSSFYDGKTGVLLG